MSRDGEHSSVASKRPRLNNDLVDQSADQPAQQRTPAARNSSTILSSVAESSGIVRSATTVGVSSAAGTGEVRVPTTSAASIPAGGSSGAVGTSDRQADGSVPSPIGSDGNRILVKELLDQRLIDLLYKENHGSSASTNATGARNAIVAEWSGFDDFIFETLLFASRLGIFAQYARLISSVAGFVNKETAIHGQLLANCFNHLNVIPYLANIGQFLLPGEKTGEDFRFTKCEGNLPEGDTLLVGECKPPWNILLAGDEKLWEMYRLGRTNHDKTREDRVRKAVRQVYGQMYDAGVKYGVLTTYVQWWFLVRTDDDRLLISRTVNASELFHLTVFKCLFSLVINGQEKDDFFFKPEVPETQIPELILRRDAAVGGGRPSGRRGNDEQSSSLDTEPKSEFRSGEGNDDSDGRPDSGLSSDDYCGHFSRLSDPGCLHLFKMVGSGVSGFVARGKLCELDVVAKVFHPSARDDFIIEMRIYSAIASTAAASVVPEVLCVVDLPAYFPIIVFKDDHAMPFVSSTHAHLKQNVINAFTMLHSAGVLHGDLRIHNILATPSQGVKIIDFAKSHLAADAADLADEMESVYELLDMEPPVVGAAQAAKLDAKNELDDSGLSVG